MVAVVRMAAEAVAENGPWMAWNLMLALVPLALATVLFLPARRRTVLWWMGVVAFVAFLPNAPYVLTDIIHLTADARTTPRVVLSLALVPQYLAFFLLGFEAYVLSLLLVGRALRRAGRANWVVPVEVGLHVLCAVGIHMGRFSRLNTWDMIARPDLIWRGVAGISLPLVVAAFVAVTAAYLVMKHITIAVLAYQPQRAETNFP
jgi:uncharacterized membrane protein